MMAGRAQTRGINCLARLRLFFAWYIPCHSVLLKLERALSASLGCARSFRSRQVQIECVSRISRDGSATRRRTALTRPQPSASAKRWPVRIGWLGRPIRRIHPPLSIGGSTRPHNSVLSWKDRASSLVPAVANTPRRQKGCEAPCCSPLQTPFCEQTSRRSLACGAFARLSAIARVGRLLRSRLKRRPASIAELGVLLSETNRYLIRIGDECPAKSEHVGRVG
jgi:hypothetical protein